MADQRILDASLSLEPHLGDGANLYAVRSILRELHEKGWRSGHLAGYYERATDTRFRADRKADAEASPEPQP